MTNSESVHSLNGWLCLWQHIWVFHYCVFIDFLWPNKSVQYCVISWLYMNNMVMGKEFFHMTNILLKIGNTWLQIVIERQIHKPLSYTRCGSMPASCLVVPKRNRKEQLCKTGWSLGCHRIKGTKIIILHAHNVFVSCFQKTCYPTYLQTIFLLSYLILKH